MNYKYLLIFEDGSMKGARQWDEDWDASIEEGVLAVINMETGLERYKESWHEIETD